MRHKPTRVDAVEAKSGNLYALARWCNGRVRYDWRRSTKYVRVPTTEGWRPLYPGDWLIFGALGEFYPVSDSVIRNSYDREGGPVLGNGPGAAPDWAGFDWRTAVCGSCGGRFLGYADMEVWPSPAGYSVARHRLAGRCDERSGYLEEKR